MDFAKNYNKNSKESKKGKTKSKHHEQHESPTKSKNYDSALFKSSLFPFINKKMADNLNKGTLFSCPQKSCKCSFSISSADLEGTIIVCPQGHNICSEVNFFKNSKLYSFFKKCLELSHFPISCSILKMWITSGFQSLKSLKAPDLKLINCPKCEFAFQETTSKRVFCSKCAYSFCELCMKEWKWGYSGHENHPCVKNTYKGETRSKAQTFLNELEVLEKEFPQFIQEKTRQEEDLGKIKDYFDEKHYKLKETDENENDQIIDFFWFVDAINGNFLSYRD